MFQSEDRKSNHEGTGLCFPPIVLVCIAAMPCCAFSFVQQYIQQAYQKRGRLILSRVCTYVRHASERRGRRTSDNRPQREAYVASELFSPEAWRQDSWHYQVTSVQLRSIMMKLYSIMDLCPLTIVILMCFSFVNKCSGRRRPLAERTALKLLTDIYVTF